MAEPYLTELEDLLGRLDVECDAEIVCRHFFSGAAANVDGAIFLLLSPAGIALKLPADQCEDLFREGATRLRYFPDAPVKKNYAVLPPRVAADNATLLPLIKRAAKHASGRE